MLQVIVMDIKRTRKIQEFVEQRCLQNLCLVPDCQNQQRAMGRCVKHAQQVYRKLATVPKAQRNKARGALIEKGLILANHESYTYRADDELTKAINEVIS